MSETGYFDYRKSEVDKESSRLFQLSLRPSHDALAKLSEWAHYRRTICAFNMNDFSTAILEATAALKLNEHNAWAHHLRGVAHSRLKHVEEAISDLSRSIDLEPNIAGFWFARAMARLAFGSTVDTEHELAPRALRLSRDGLEPIESDLVRTVKLDPSLPNAREWLDSVREGRRTAGV